MPYKLSDSGTCVHKENADHSLGKLIKCHKTHDEAVSHMKALYAAMDREGKKNKELSDLAVEELVEKMTDIELAAELDEKGDGMMGEYGMSMMAEPMMSLADLEEAEANAQRAMDFQTLNSRFQIVASTILTYPELEAKERAEALHNVVDEWSDRANAIVAAPVSDELDDKEIDEKAISKREDVSAADKKRAVAEYGNVTYADPKNKKYPLSTEKHVRSAWSYVNMPRNAKKYSSSELSAIKGRIISAWKKMIDKAGPPEAQKKEIGDIVDAVVLRMKELLGIETDEPQMLIWKDNDTGLYQWLARYSNNLRDDDIPTPEIISETSHKLYAERVNKGELPYPTLQWWHVPDWTWGKSTWVGYDDSGFALAAGYVYPGCESFAESVSKQKGIAVSHGMLPDSIVRDPDDPTVIIQHQTVELSPLPVWAAANKVTDFIFLNKEATMAIPKEQKLAATAKMGIAPELLEAIEKQNAALASKAKEAGIEAKETGEQPVAETALVETQPPAPEVKPEDEKKDETPVETPAETPVAEMKETPVEDPTAAFLAALKGVTDQLEAVTKELAELKVEGNKQKELLLQTPSASLNTILAQRAVGAEETKIKGTEHLARLHPAHSETNESRTGLINIPFINEMLSKQPPRAEQ